MKEMRRLRIAIFTDAFLPQVNGIVISTLDLARNLADRGHKIYIVAPKYKGIQEFKHKNMIVRRVASMPALFYPDFKFTSFFSHSIIQFLKKEKIEIIHFQTPLTVGLQGIFASKILNLPLVGTFHTFFTDREYLKHAGLDFHVMERLAWGYANASYGRCDVITCPTESAKKELMKNGIKTKIKVISNGIDNKMFDSRKYKEIRKKYNPDGPLLLFVGRIAHEKNISYLLECFKLITEEIPKARLLMVGDGPQMDEVRENITELDLDKKVIVTGEIPHDKLIKSSIFKACDLFITASTTETQGITMLEAQVNGLVCVAMNARGVRDLIKDKHNGFLAKEGDKRDFAEKAIRLLKNKRLLKKIRKNTLKEIKTHYMANVIQEWENTYGGLMKHG